MQLDLNTVARLAVELITFSQAQVDPATATFPFRDNEIHDTVSLLFDLLMIVHANFLTSVWRHVRTGRTRKLAVADLIKCNLQNLTWLAASYNLSPQ